MKKLALFVLGLLAILYFRQKIAAGATETAKSELELAEVGYFKEQGVMGSERRVYSIAVEGFVDNEAVWNEINEYGRKKLWSQGSYTAVFFFDGRSNTPDVTDSGENFPNAYREYCVAAFWRYTKWNVYLDKYPFRNGSPAL
ncbi:MAG: hypothetical protein IH972_01200 [Candidatus Marinimicrobia bacterium]|nr:hypothetical protein [Candidatus Neomarinimicrobiota bacterium]